MFSRTIIILVLTAAATFPSAAERDAKTKISYIANFVPKVGAHPMSQPIAVSDGSYWGVLPEMSRHDLGAIYKLSPQGVLSVVHRFKGTDGRNPSAKLVQASDGAIYGTTSTGGGKKKQCGVVFRITLDGEFSVPHIFDCGHDGANPSGGLIQGSDGRLYGLTYSGGKSNAGIAYALTLDGQFARFANFTPIGFGANPIGELTEVGNGDLWGIASTGGPREAGTMFSISPAGQLARHYAFSSDAPPNGHLTFSKENGNLYGTLSTGNIFIYADGNFETYATSRFGRLTGGVSFGTDGTTLYGYCMSESSGGCVYQIPAPHKIARLLSRIKGEIDGEPLVLDTNQVVGVTKSGGSQDLGTAFNLSPENN